MASPTIGVESIFFSLMVSSVLVLYAIMFYPVCKRSYKLKTKNRYNTLLLIILLFILAAVISLPLSDSVFYIFMPLNYYIVVVTGALAVLFFIFAMVKKKTIDEVSAEKKLSEGMDNRLEKSILDTHHFTPKQEMKRKMFHLLAILYVATWMLEPLVFYGVKFIYAGIANTPTAENYGNSKYLFEDSDVELILLNGLVVQFFMLMCIFIGNANAEIMRLRFKEYAFPLKKTLLTTRRSTEINDTSASMLLLIGLALSSIILTFGSTDRIKGVYAQMAVICIAVFSDMFAALIGRKWGGKFFKKWKMVPGKSKEGTLAGFTVGVCTAMIFIGPILALIGGLIFVFTDLALDKVKISDNALNPILISITFKILIFLTDPMIVILPIIKIW